MMNSILTKVIFIFIFNIHVKISFMLKLTIHFGHSMICKETFGYMPETHGMWPYFDWLWGLRSSYSSHYSTRIVEVHSWRALLVVEYSTTWTHNIPIKGWPFEVCLRRKKLHYHNSISTCHYICTCVGCTYKEAACPWRVKQTWHEYPKDSSLVGRADCVIPWTH